MGACAIVVGNLGKDAELQARDGGSSTLKFSVAATNYKKVTTWFNCTLWGVRGEKLSTHLTRGTKVMVRGELCLNKYSGRDGQERVSLDLNVDNVELLGSRADSREEGRGFDQPNDDIPF